MSAPYPLVDVHSLLSVKWSGGRRHEETASVGEVVDQDQHPYHYRGCSGPLRVVQLTCEVDVHRCHACSSMWDL